MSSRVTSRRLASPPRIHGPFTRNTRVVTSIRDVIAVTRLRSVHPWIRAKMVVFADDTIGVQPDGEPARVDQDVVVTAVVPARDGGVLVLLREFREDEAS